jgi:malonyl-CoA decarboxylase
VVEVLSREFPRLKVFCTLSPIPGFVAWLSALLKQSDSARSKAPSLAAALMAVEGGVGSDLAKATGDPDCVKRLSSLQVPLTQLCAAYLLRRAEASVPTLDPVARFHLNNGARLDRINWLADTSKKGLRESLGLMVNYLYEPRAIESNHEKFVRGEIVAARQVRSMALGP